MAAARTHATRCQAARRSRTAEMTPLALALLLFAIMLVLMALRVPIAVAMFAAGLTGYLMKAGWLPLAARGLVAGVSPAMVA